MKIVNIIARIFTMWTIGMFFILKSAGFVMIHKDDIVPEPVAVIEKCTTEQALQWWVGKENLTEVRQRLCANNFSKSK